MTKGVCMDQDALECAMLNTKVTKRIEANEAAMVEQNRHKEEAHKEKRKAYTMHTIRYILIRLLVAVAAASAAMAGMTRPVLSISIATLSLCMACLRLGRWMEKRRCL